MVFRPVPPTEPGCIDLLERDGCLPNIRDKLSMFHMPTLETIERVYGKESYLTPVLCLTASWNYAHNPDGPTISLFDWDKEAIIAANPVPLSIPYLPDTQAKKIPRNITIRETPLMNDIVEAIRQNMYYESTFIGRFYFEGPTTQVIQRWLSEEWPDVYPPGTKLATGWRNSVNQCITHGQGWNFVTYPIDSYGDPVRRHVLFERAYNGTFILPAHLCRRLNALKRDEEDEMDVGSPPSTTSSNASTIVEDYDDDMSSSGSSSQGSPMSQVEED